MNLTEALNVALPDLPARTAAKRYPRLHPKAVFREHEEQGARTVRVFIPEGGDIFNFTPENWQLMQLFDGERSHEEIAELYREQTGIAYTPEDVREMADAMAAMDFWYKTPLEKNVALMQMNAEQRRKAAKKKSKWGDLSNVAFSAWDPDRFLDWLHARISFVYKPWFTVLTLASFTLMVYIFVARWDEVARDTVQFYQFSEKTFLEFVGFWVLAAALLSIHETAHGLTCKHYGGHVHQMGFLLIYLTPAFYTDVTEGLVLAGRNERIAIVVSGVWIELIICSIATPIWWAAPAGTFAHDFAYTIMLITGLGVVFINWNPLMKLDGYYILTELIGIPDLKEASTAYVAAWVKRHVWRLPVEVPYVPPRRRTGYVFYALTSGLYSYSVLTVLARFTGNVFRNFNPEWSFIPELAVAALIFRSRIRNLVRFMNFVYLDKKDKVRAWLTPQRRIAVGAVAAVVLLLPVWRESATGQFILEPKQRAVLRAAVPGTVAEVLADEGDAVAQGAPLIRLRNLELESRSAQTAAEYRVAAARAITAQLRYTDFGPAAQERNRLAEQNRALAAEVANLQLNSPISGVVITPRVRDRLGSYVEAGTELIEVADLRTMRARFYVPEHELRKVEANAPTRLQFDGFFGMRTAQSVSISPASSEMEEGMSDKTKYKGLRPPNYYVLDVNIDNSEGALKVGMTGVARVYGKRRSVVGLVFETVASFLGRKIW
ncbi:MAG: HlyD family efflux transporter periplasmic adaptor subunit [Terriglobales bacterium]